MADKMSHFLHDNDNADAKALAIPLVFSKNTQAKNVNLSILKTFADVY